MKPGEKLTSILLLFDALFLSACSPRIFGISGSLSGSYSDISSHLTEYNASYFQLSSNNTSHLSFVDLDQNGIKELVSYDWSTRALTTWSMVDAPFLSKLSTASVGSGTEIYYVNFADMNRDSVPDLVFSGRLPARLNVVNVRFGLGDGTFGAQASYDGCDRNYRISIGDVNNDGYDDIVCGTGDVFLNNGDGTLGAPVVYDPAGHGSEQYGFGPQLLDVNQDGFIDAVGTAGVLINQAGAGFAPIATYGGFGFKAIADVNGDGFPDGATINGGTDVDIYLNQGDGTFAFDSQINVSGTDLDYLTFSDLNGDGIKDLVVADRIALKTSIYINDGQGVFTHLSDFTSAAGYSLMDSILVDDFDRDGDNDIAYIDGHLTAATYILLNDGQGHFEKTLNRKSVNTPIQGALALAGDLNGDGFPDLFSFLQDSTYQVHLNQGDGSFGATVDTGAGSASHAGFYDFNHDGFLDVLYCSDQIYLQLGNGDGTFAAPNSYVISAGMSTSCVAADFNLDGHLDVVATDYSAASVVYRFGNGDGTLGAEVAIVSVNEPIAIRAADMNDDGYPDLLELNVIGSASFDVLLYLNQQNGTFSAASVIASGSTTLSGYGGFEVSDLDQDGGLDIVVMADQISTYKNLNNGTWAPAVHYSGMHNFVLSLEHQLTVSDVNQDAYPDLVYVDQGGINGIVSYRINQGDGTFGAPKALMATDPSSIFTIAVAQDMNQDGYPELITTGSEFLISIVEF